MKQTISTIGSLLISTVLWAQVPNNVPIVFRNTGKMNISKASTTPNIHSTANMLVNGSIHITDNTELTSVAFTGGIGLTGHFIQDSQGTIFKTIQNSTIYANGKAETYGFISFRGSVDQYITSSDTINFNREERYIPFTGIELATNQRVVIPSKMGIDAVSIKRKTPNTGTIWLSSNPIGDNIYDASLRITSETAQVDDGIVVVERYFDTYKDKSGAGSQKSLLFPFATPFDGTQASGYFAGHWIRRATNTYIYGDKDANGDKVVDRDQYVIDPHEALLPGRAYLVKPRVDSDFDESFVSDGLNLAITGSPVANYIKPKFTLNGSVYTFAPVQEKLNVKGVEITNLSTSADSMVNVVFGNSSTTAVGFDKLVDYLGNQTALPIGRYLYVYVPGSNSYVAVDMAGPNVESPASLIENGDIPAMGVYIVRLSKRAQAMTGSLKISPDLYSHGTNGHNLRATRIFSNEVLFRAVNKENPFQFDLAAIGYRVSAHKTLDALDIQKLGGLGLGLQMYTKSSDGVKLASNSIPLLTDSIRIYVEPNGIDATYILNAERTESLLQEALILEDLKTGKRFDLLANNVMEFSVSKNDDPERFLLHFKRDDGTSIDEVTQGNMIKIFYKDNQLTAWELDETDLGSEIVIYNLQGMKLSTTPVANYPKFSIPINLPKGVYIAKLTGKKNVTIKFVI